MNVLPALPFLPVIAALILLVISFVKFPYDPQRLGRMQTIWRLPQSVLIIGFALLSASIYSGPTTTRLTTLPLLILAGMVAGFSGDLFMANVFKQKEHVRNGMIAFAIGHVCYLFAFREIALWLNLHVLAYYGLALSVMYMVTAAVWYKFIRTPQRRPLEYAALVYALFLATMAGYAWGLELHLLFQPTAGHKLLLLPLAVGATLFLFSDTLIAMQLFAQRTFPYMGDVIWTTYILAQILIVSVVFMTWYPGGPYILPLF